MSNPIEAIIIIVFCILIVVAFIAGVGYMLGAEEVSCNALWCEFKLPTTIEQTCYRDGIQVNCSEVANTISNFTEQ